MISKHSVRASHTRVIIVDTYLDLKHNFFFFGKLKESISTWNQFFIRKIVTQCQFVLWSSVLGEWKILWVLRFRIRFFASAGPIYSLELFTLHIAIATFSSTAETIYSSSKSLQFAFFHISSTARRVNLAESRWWHSSSRETTAE